MALYRIFDHSEECLLDGRRPLLSGVRSQCWRTQIHPSLRRLQVFRYVVLPTPAAPLEHGHRTHGEAVQQAVGSLLLNGSENDFEFHMEYTSPGTEKYTTTRNFNY